MAVPAYVNVDTQSSAGAYALTFSLPSGGSEGDLILVFVKQCENTTQRIWDDDGGGGNGYTQIQYHRSTGGRDQETAVYWKHHEGASEAASPVFTWWSGGTTSEPMSGIMLIYSGVDTVEPIEDHSWMWNQNDTTPPNPAVTLTKANNRIVVFHAATHDDITAILAPSGYTMRGYNWNGASEDWRDSFSADAEIDSTGSYTPPDWQHTGSSVPEYHTYTIALREPVPIHLLDCNTDEIIDLLETGCVATGDGFGTSQGVNGKVELWSDISGTIKVSQTVTTWTADTSITFTAVTGGLSTGWNFLVVTNNSLEESAPLEIWYGPFPWNPAVATDADLYWRMDNDYGDTGIQNEDADFDIIQRGNFSFQTVPLAVDTTYSWYVPDETGGSEPPSSDYTNITNTHTYRNIGGFFKYTAYQLTPAVIYEEGGGVNNIYFLMLPNGKLVANVADSNGAPSFKYEVYADFKLIINRVYHIMIAAQFGSYFRIYVDGELQTSAGGGDLGSDTTMSTHSGDWSFGDPGANLDTGGVDIAYNACSPMYLAHWGTWSGIGGGSPLTATQIKNELFRDGSLSEHTISTGTESAMQTAMEAYDTQTHADFALTYDVEPQTGGGDLELTITDQVWPDECKFHVRWLSEVATDDLTIRNSGTSNFAVAKAYSKDGGSIIVIETATLLITVKDLSTDEVIEGAYVLVEAGATGPLTEDDDIIKGETDAQGQITAEIDYTSAQSIKGWVRDYTGTKKYQQSTIVGSIVSTGLELTIFMVGDE